MVRRPSESLHRETAAVLAGILLPILVAAVFQNLLSLYVDGAGYTAVAAVLFAVGSWYCLERWELDRVSFVVAGVFIPTVLFFGGALVLTVVYEAVDSLIRYLFFDLAGYFRYLGSFAVAALAVAALSRRIDSVAERRPRVPRPCGWFSSSCLWFSPESSWWRERTSWRPVRRQSQPSTRSSATGPTPV